MLQSVSHQLIQLLHQSIEFGHRGLDGAGLGHVRAGVQSEVEFVMLSELRRVDYNRAMTLIHPDNLTITLPLQAIAEECRKWGVKEMAVFGSVLRGDFSDGSDIDFLVRFIDNDAGEWMGKLQDLEAALESVLGRKVDVVDWLGVEQSANPYRREHILRTARPIYAAG